MFDHLFITIFIESNWIESNWIELNAFSLFSYYYSRSREKSIITTKIKINKMQMQIQIQIPINIQKIPTRPGTPPGLFALSRATPNAARRLENDQQQRDAVQPHRSSGSRQAIPQFAVGIYVGTRSPKGGVCLEQYVAPAETNGQQCRVCGFKCKRFFQ